MSTGNRSGVHEEGRIAIKVEPWPVGMFTEYIDNPEENKKSFVNGWYYTGDKAYKDEDGYYWFIGRDDDVIKASGYRIGPFEVESALIEHPFRAGGSGCWFSRRYPGPDRQGVCNLKTRMLVRQMRWSGISRVM